MIDNADWQALGTDEAASRRGFAHALWQRKWWVLLFLIACVGLGAAYVQYGTPVYQATARLLLEQVQPAGSVAKKIPHGVEFADTQAQVLNSPVLVRDAVASLNLPGVDPTNLVALLEIMDSLKIARVPQTDVVSASFRHEDPAVALGLLQALVKKYQEYLVQEQKLADTTQPARTDTLKIETELWKAQADRKAAAERFGPKHPEMRAAEETAAHWERVYAEHAALIDASGARSDLNEELLASVGGVKIATLDGPVLVDGPVWPNPLIVYPVAALVGLLLGCGAVVLMDRGDDSLRTASDIEWALGVPAGGQIPHSSAHNIHRYTLEAPNSALARAIYSLSQELLHGEKSDQGLVVQVTSPRDQSGKTTVVANLAFSLAQQGKKVCVIDGDLRRGILHRVLDVSSAKGLSSLTRKGAELEEILQTSPLAPLDVLTKGPGVRNPLHLLAQPRVEAAFEALRWQYDIVLVDTPPLLKLSDASLLVPLADVVLVVLQSGTSTAADVRRAIEMLKIVGTKKISIVLNGSPIEHWMVDGDAMQPRGRADSRRTTPDVAPSRSVT